MFGGSHNQLRPGANRPQRRCRWWVVWLCGMEVCFIAGCSAFSPRHEVLQVASQEAGGENSSLLKQALRKYQSGHLDDAASKYEQALAANPGLGIAHNNLGLIRYQQRKLVPAAEHFDKAIQLLPGDPRPLNNLGLTLEAGGRVMEAIELYAAASDLETDNPHYLGNWLRARVRMGEVSEELTALLEHLAFIETRADWLSWTDEQLAIYRNPVLDRGPAPPNKLNQRKASEDRPAGLPLDAQPAADLPDPVIEPLIPLTPATRLDENVGDESIMKEDRETLPVPAPQSIWERIDDLQ